MRHRERLREARRRGIARGINSAQHVENPKFAETPEFLSGEWAGESIVELLGDLLWGNGDSRDYSEKDTEIEDVYEKAAENAFIEECVRRAEILDTSYRLAMLDAENEPIENLEAAGRIIDALEEQRAK